MMFNYQIKGLALVLLQVVCGANVQARSKPVSPPRVFLLNARFLQQKKQQLSYPRGTATLRPAVVKLESDAQTALTAPYPSLVDKTSMPPSGDKHDYLSQAPYWWPDPKSPNGLPYLRRDGEVNPEIKKIPDHDRWDKMVTTVETLSLAYYFTENEAYAARAAQILRMWFLDPATKMNPNLEYAQAIPGRNSGRGIGLIETRNIPRVFDSIGLLAGSKAWSKEDLDRFNFWVATYLKWLTTSVNGRAESKEANNHGTFYDVQLVACALFLGQTELARNTLEAAKTNRIAKQIEPDGRQPLELARTKSWGYSNMNLSGLIELAELGQSVGMDLWNYQTADKRGIRQAIVFLAPFTADHSLWKTQQIVEFNDTELFSNMRRAAAIYHDAAYVKLMATVPKPAPEDRHGLLGQ
jgi:hypothetical protein